MAGTEELASKLESKLGITFCAIHLEYAQRARVLVLLLHPDVGDLRHLFFFSPADKYAGRILSGLSELHFGGFGWYTEVLWAILGLVPAFLAFTGLFVCCHRMIYHRSSNPNI